MNKCWEGSINRIYVDSENENYLVVEAVIPEGIGGWYITEFGIINEDDDLVAIGGYPKTYKPKLTEGSGSSLYLKVVFEISNAEVVQLKIDPAIVLASREFVGEQLTKHVSEDNPHQQYLKKAEYQTSQTVLSSELAKFPIYPEIVNEEHRLAITDNGNGSITIDGGQVIRWRGHKDFSTDAYTKEQRTFVIDKEKTYHLRWKPDQGFTLKDITSVDYNPDQLDEKDKTFDTSFDDVLVACLNKGEIVSLSNAVQLTVDAIHLSAANNTTLQTKINWARTPKGYVVGMHDPNNNNITTDYGVVPDAFDKVGTDNTRYDAYVAIISWSQNHGRGGEISVRVRWEA